MTQSNLKRQDLVNLLDSLLCYPIIMKHFSEAIEEYWKNLENRSETSKVYKSYQLIGLQIADILEDRSHKALYIKLAKTHDNQRLLETAKDVAGRKDVANKGAYFMSIFFKK